MRTPTNLELNYNYYVIYRHRWYYYGDKSNVEAFLDTTFLYTHYLIQIIIVRNFKLKPHILKKFKNFYSSTIVVMYLTRIIYIYLHYLLYIIKI
jgi:hypothetical protein